MRGITGASLALLLVFGGCGGGGSDVPEAAAPEQEQVVSMGLVRGDLSTTAPLVVTKPFGEAGVVDLAEDPAGPFRPLASTLPLPVAAGDRAVVWVTFTPPAAAAHAQQEGTIRLVFRRTAGAAEFPVVLRVGAEIEEPSARLLETRLELGSVPVGEKVPCGVTFENTSLVTPVRVDALSLPEGDFSIAPDALDLPVLVAPGSKLALPVSYMPQGATPASAVLRVFHSVAPEPLEATLGAMGIEQQIFVEYGLVELDPVTRETEWLSFDVPPEGVGIFIEAWGDPMSVIDLVGLEGPSGKVYEAEDLGGPLAWLSGYPAGGRGFLGVGVPDSDLPEVQLEEGGGTYRFRLRHDTAEYPGLVVRVTIPQRRLGVVSEGTLDIRVFLADGLAITDRTDPMRDPKLAATVRTIDGILGESGIRLGKILFTSMATEFDMVADEDDAEMLFVANSASPPEGARLNLFLVKEMSGGTAAFAGASPGNGLNGLPFSGVVAEYDTASGILVGVRAAHAISHYLGSFGMDVFPSPAAAHPMLRHPLVAPGLPETFLAPPATYEQAQVMAASLPPASTWCGTCTHAPVR